MHLHKNHWWMLNNWVDGKFFKFYFTFNWRMISILWWFLPHINMNQPEVYICPLPLKPPCHLPPHTTLLGCHSTGFGFPVSYSKLMGIFLMNGSDGQLLSLLIILASHKNWGKWSIVRINVKHRQNWTWI